MEDHLKDAAILFVILVAVLSVIARATCKSWTETIDVYFMKDKSP